MSQIDSIPLYEAMSTLRAVRRLLSDPIPDDVLQRILQAAAWAPSGGNVQPWRIIAVRDSNKRRSIGELYHPQWQRYAVGARAGLEQMQGETRAKRERMLDACDHLGDHMGEAPVHLVFCADPSRMAITDAGLDRVSMIGGGSVYPPIQNAMLACRAEGLGCVLTTLLCFEEDAVKDLLEIPDGWATVGMVPIGYPMLRGHGPINRKPPSVMAARDTFDGAWP